MTSEGGIFLHHHSARDNLFFQSVPNVLRVSPWPQEGAHQTRGTQEGESFKQKEVKILHHLLCRCVPLTSRKNARCIIIALLACFF